MRAYKVIQKQCFSVLGLKREGTSCSKRVCQRYNKKRERIFQQRLAKREEE